MMPHVKPHIYQRVMLRVRVLQISGIALLTLGTLNMMFMPAIAKHVDIVLLIFGVLQLWFSYCLWLRFKRRYMMFRY